MDTDEIGLIVLIVAVAVVLVAGKLQQRDRKEDPSA
jgi:hypothetical protein